MLVIAKGQVVASNMVYFIDCNSPDSPIYAAVDQYAGLLNEKADQTLTEGSWGYLAGYGQYNGDSDDKYDTGWYAYSNQSIQYTAPLEAGTYQVTFGFKEWWKDSNKSRKMTMTATQNGDTAVLGNSNTWKSSNWWNSDSYELICNETGSVTFSINKVSGQSDPVLSFIEIQKVLNLTALKEAMVEAAGRSIALKGAAT